MDVTRLRREQHCVGRDNLCRLENKMKENKEKLYSNILTYAVERILK